MKQFLGFLVSVAALAATSAMAQMGPFGGVNNFAMNSSMAKLFGNNSAFSARAELTITDSSHGKSMAMEMTMSMLDGKRRMEMDMSKMTGGHMNPNANAQMKAMGLDRMIVISLPEKQVSLMVYPSFHAYAEMSAGQSAPAAESARAAQGGHENGKDFKIDKTSMGRENIDGHDCEKNKVLITTDQGAHHEWIVWNATDLKDFPIQMQMNESANTILIKYKEVKFEKPDASLFEAPADFTKYDSMQALMQGEMMKRAGAFGH